MKLPLTLFFLFIIPWCVVAQQNDCDFYIQQDQTRKKVRRSVYPLDFSVSESIDVSIKIGDKVTPGIIEFTFDFEDASGLPVELGSTLTIKFTDQTTYSIIASSRNIKSSIVYFTITDTGSHTSNTHHSTKADRFLTDKLSKVDIRAFEITADYKEREIPVTETKSAIIKKTITCLLDRY